MAFITAAELRTRIEAMLNQDAIDVDDSWDVFIADAVEAGYQEIVSAFVARGLTKAQADTWARGREFNFDQSEFWAFVHAGVPHSYSDVYLNKLDRRAELLTMTLLDANGDEIVPVPPQTAVGYGVIKHHELDSFTKNDGLRGGAGSFRKC